MKPDRSARRDVLKAAGAAFTTSIFTGNVRGANDKIAVAFLGTGSMGTGNIKYAMQVPGIHVAAVCDVFQPRLDNAVAEAAKGGYKPKLFAISARYSRTSPSTLSASPHPTTGMPS